MVSNSPNPLSSFMRQPKIYIRLPSGGQYWPAGSIIPTENGEFPVYSMTARDELLLKVPDALLSGQAVVDVIQNCIPNIKNAWQIPSIDLDVILIALRLATYGEQMKTPVSLNDDIEIEHTIDLRTVLDALQNSIIWDPLIQINDELIVYVKPLTYKQIADSALKTFETQKIMSVINNDTINDEEKIKIFQESFNKLTEVTINLVQNSVYMVESTAGTTDNQQHIQEFLNNIDKEIFNKIQSHLDDLKNRNEIKPIVIDTPQEYKDRGYQNDTIEIPLVFNPSTFFA